MATGRGGYRSNARKARREERLSEVVAGLYGADLAALVAKLMDAGPVAAETAATRESVRPAEIVPKSKGVRKRDMEVEPSTEPAAKIFLPLPAEYSEGILLEAAGHSDRARGIRIRVIASLYAGLDHAAAARANKVGLGDVYLWLAAFRKDGLAGL